MDTNSLLKIALIKRGLSKKALADSLGITPSYLAHLVKWVHSGDEALIPNSVKAKKAAVRIKELIKAEYNQTIAQN